ncbi:hypothetical protein Efla_007631 [Eimeria flavescens]
MENASDGHPSRILLHVILEVLQFRKGICVAALAGVHYLWGKPAPFTLGGCSFTIVERSYRFRLWTFGLWRALGVQALECRESRSNEMAFSPHADNQSHPRYQRAFQVARSGRKLSRGARNALRCSKLTYQQYQLQQIYAVTCDKDAPDQIANLFNKSHLTAQRYPGNSGLPKGRLHLSVDMMRENQLGVLVLRSRQSRSIEMAFSPHADNQSHPRYQRAFQVARSGRRLSRGTRKVLRCSKLTYQQYQLQQVYTVTCDKDAPDLCRERCTDNQWLLEFESEPICAGYQGILESQVVPLFSAQCGSASRAPASGN